MNKKYSRRGVRSTRVDHVDSERIRELPDGVQRVLLPTDSMKWPTIKTKMAASVDNIVQLDSLFVSLHEGKFKSRTVQDAFRRYHDSNDTLLKIYTEQQIIEKLVPLWRRLVLGARSLFREPIAVLGAGTCNQSLTRLQVATLMTFAWFGLVETGAKLSRGVVKIKHMSRFCFLNIFKSGSIYTLHCLLRYFMVVAEQLETSSDVFERSVIVVHRRALPQAPAWATSTKLIGEVFMTTPYVASGEEPDVIFETCSCQKILCKKNFQTDLDYEEISFLMYPEALVATLLCTQLDDADSIIVLGAQKMCHITGFSGSARYARDYDYVRYGQSSHEYMAQTALICIDASPKISAIDQLIDTFDRDLNKAYSGFSALSFHDAILTGHWSTILFSGNMQVKFIQQLLAASESDKLLVYQVSSREFEEKICDFMRWMADDEITVGQLYKMYRQVIAKHARGNRFSEVDLFESIMAIA